MIPPLFPLLLIVTLTMFSCNKVADPEEEIVNYLGIFEKNAEAKNNRELRKLISDDYHDMYAYKKNDIAQILSAYFFRTPQIYILHRIEKIEIDETQTSAKVLLYAAITQTPVEKDDIELLRAEVHQFEITLQKKKSWLLTAVQWQRAEPQDFIGNQREYSSAK